MRTETSFNQRGHCQCFFAFLACALGLGCSLKETFPDPPKPFLSPYYAAGFPPGVRDSETVTGYPPPYRAQSLEEKMEKCTSKHHAACKCLDSKGWEVIEGFLEETKPQLLPQRAVAGQMPGPSFTSPHPTPPPAAPSPSPYPHSL